MPAEVKITQPVRTITNPQAHWNIDIFHDAIQEHGYKVYIDRALQCPCRNRSTNSAMSNCINCNGSGWMFIDRQETVLLCSSMSNRNKYENWTSSNAGTVNIGAMAQDKLGFMDRITMTELESWHTQVLQMTKHPIDDVLFCFTTYEPISVFHVYQFIDEATPLSLLTKDQDYYVQGNKIVLSDELSAEVDTATLTVRYTHRPVYHVIDINRDLVKQITQQNCPDKTNLKANFPINCVARRAHYILDADNYSGASVTDNTDYDTPNIPYEQH